MSVANRILIAIMALAIGLGMESCAEVVRATDPDSGAKPPIPPTPPDSIVPPTPPPPTPPDSIVPPAPPAIDKLLVKHGYAELTDLSERELYRHMFDTLSNYKYETADHLKLHIYDIYTPGYRITKISLQRVINRLMDDNPQLFHLGNIVPWSYQQGGYIGELKIQFSSNRSEYDKMLAPVEQRADKILECVTPGMSEYQRAKAIHDTFLAKVSYGMAQGSEGSIFGAFTHGKIVCEGYARGLQYLYQRAGLQAIYVQGLATTSTTPLTFTMHAWIVVRIDGKHYYIDPTWNDSMLPGSTECHWEYFLKSLAYMKDRGYHPMQGAGYPQAEMQPDPETFQRNVANMTTLPSCDNNY